MNVEVNGDEVASQGSKVIPIESMTRLIQLGQYPKTAVYLFRGSKDKACNQSVDASTVNSTPSAATKIGPDSPYQENYPTPIHSVSQDLSQTANVSDTEHNILKHIEAAEHGRTNSLEHPRRIGKAPQCKPPPGDHADVSK